MSEVVFDKYELRNGSGVFQEVEAASAEDIKAYVSEKYPGWSLWVVNKTRNTKPFLIVPIRVR